MTAARLVTTKKGDNQFTKDTQICVSSQPEAAAAQRITVTSLAYLVPVVSSFMTPSIFFTV